jgi:hypothetical protein
MHFSRRISILLLAYITLINADLNNRLDCYLESKYPFTIKFSLINSIIRFQNLINKSSNIKTI